MLFTPRGLHGPQTLGIFKKYNFVLSPIIF